MNTSTEDLLQKLIGKQSDLRCLTESEIEELTSQENNTDIKKLVDDSAVIKEIMENLGLTIENQGKLLDCADESTNNAVTNVVEAERQISSAKKSFFLSHLIKGTILSTVVGLAFGGIGGGVIGYVIGSSVALASGTGAVVGSGISGTAGYAIIKKKSQL
jgi:hypothetical protein